MKMRLRLRHGMPCLLFCLGLDCGYDDDTRFTRDAILVNQTDSPLDVLVRKPTVPCVEVASEYITDLTQSDFGPAETLSYPPRSLSAFSVGDNCQTEIFWLQIGDFSGIVRWSSLQGTEIPEDITDGSKSRAIFVEGRKDKLVVAVGDALESFPTPREGPPALRPDTLEFPEGGPDSYPSL